MLFLRDQRNCNWISLWIGFLCSCIITVSAVPSINVQPSPVATVTEGSVLWLTCMYDLDGGTLGQLWWQDKDGGNVATATPRATIICSTTSPANYTPDCSQLSSNEVRLGILNPVHGDTYSCTVYLSNYTLIGSKSTQVAIVVPVPIVTFTPPVSHTVTVTPGGSQMYTCVTGSCRPHAQIEWYKDGVNVTTQTGSVSSVGDKFVTTSSYTLTGAKGDSPATIQCRASNVDGMTPVQSDLKNFVVQWPPDGPPVISGYTSSSTLYVNDTLSLSCRQTGGNPLSTLTWTGVCGGIPDTDGSTGTESVSTIIITVTKGYNQGTCGCVSTHPQPQGQDRSEVTFTVHYPPSTPTISGTPTHPWLKGENGTLNCNYVEGFPALTRVEWFRNGRLQTGQSAPSITLTSLTKDDNQAGYTCRVKNDFTDVKLTNLTSSVVFPNVECVQWEKKTRDTPHRGFVDDDNNVPQARRKTRAQKVSALEMMLGQITNFCPIISRSTIVKNSISLPSIWQTIRLHFGFQSTGAHFIDFASITLEANERPEDLFQRITAFIEDNFLRRDMGITHHGQEIADDEELSPTIENMAVLTWLRLINPELPRLVKQRYGTELRTRTLASIKPEISQALDSLLDEIRASDDAKVMRAAISNTRSQGLAFPPKPTPRPRATVSSKSCPLCKEAGRPSTHFLSKCTFLPLNDRKYLAKARCVMNSDAAPSDDEDSDSSNTARVEVSVNRVQIRQSPYLDAFYGHHTVRLTIDSGATGNMIHSSITAKLGVHVNKSSHVVSQADGISALHVIGETRFSFHHNGHDLFFEGLVVDNIATDVLAGIPFMEKNDISIRPSRHEVVIGDNYAYTYGSQLRGSNQHIVQRAQVLRAPVATTTTVWPGEFLEVKLPDDVAPSDETFSIEPHPTTDEPFSWPPPSLVSSVAGTIRIPNLTTEPQTVKRNEHLCKIRSTFCPEPLPPLSDMNMSTKTQTQKAGNVRYSDSVNLDPDNILSGDVKSSFQDLLGQHDSVFNPTFSGYNGAVGPLKATVNVGPVQPPQRKGRLPQYSKHQLDELQNKFDELEGLGVFLRPEGVSVNVEYVNPSFLVKKPNGGFRLVTVFADVGRYSKPQPSLMPDVDSTLRQIAQWNYIAVTDLTKSFYQIPLDKNSVYCGVVTPFRGVRVYARSAMGMPGSETALEELTCSVLGHLVQEGIVAKVADDLYCGGNSEEELLSNFGRLLDALQKSGLNLSSTKTVIAPKEVTILGWIWRQGTLRASAHRIAALASCEPPTTVTGLRSFVGAYKVLARVIKSCWSLISPLDSATAGRESKDKILWSDELLSSFRKAQTALSTNKSITLPRSNDQLWIVTDSAVKCKGLGATLYIARGNKLLLAGFFSAKLRQNQSLWIPCEIEALSIASAIKHFSPYIIQSTASACVLTDSKPCVEAYEKLCRGEFSASPRVSTFLATASRYQISIRHVAGAAILPLDFSSRNAAECEEPNCQVCSFIRYTESSVVRHITTEDVLNDSVKLPYISRPAWISIQSECSDLRRTYAHLKQGTRPSKKLTNIKDVKRYLQSASIAQDGLLVVKKDIPFEPQRERIIIPRNVLEGLLTSLHIKLDHPSTHQLKAVVHRYFFALDMDKAGERTTSGCHQCASLSKIQRHTRVQSTGDPPAKIGLMFAADVMKRERQLILVVREYVTSFTAAIILENERRKSLRDGLIYLCSEMHPLDGPFSVIRTDGAPGFSAVVNDKDLSKHRLRIEIGRVKNPNKNPVAERAIQELEDEILRQDPTCRAVTPLLLGLAVSRMNTRFRNRGLSAREMWTQRDQFTHHQIPVDDQQLISRQHDLKTANHPYSEKSKSPSNCLPTPPQSRVGDIVYVNDDRNKFYGRDRYIVVSCDGQWRNICKFAGSQLRKSSYRVKDSDLFKVPSTTSTRTERETLASDNSVLNDEDESDSCNETLPTSIGNRPMTFRENEQPLETPQPQPLPEIPSVISEIPAHEFNPQSTLNDGQETFTTPIVTNRPRREIQRPKYLDDYVTD